jgi:hypothetical protein
MEDYEMKECDWAIIEWHEEDWIPDELDEIPDGHFYVIYAAEEKGNKLLDCEILYIGMAYYQDIKTRINQRHIAYNSFEDYHEENLNKELFIIVGAIVDYSLGRITRKFCSDVEACLIANNQPYCNKHSKKGYYGRNIEVTNTGNYKPLKRTSYCGDEWVDL